MQFQIHSFPDPGGIHARETTQRPIHSNIIKSLPVYNPSSTVFEVLSAYCILPLSCAEVLPYVLAKLNYIDHQEIKKS